MWCVCVWYKPFYPYVSYVKRSSTYSIPQKLQQLCVYSEVYLVVRTLCLNTDTMCIVGKVDSSLSEDAPGFTVHCITEKPKDMNPSMTSEWKKSVTCCDILNQHIVITVGGSWFPLFYYLYTLYIFRAFSSEIPQRQATQKSHCSCLQISNPRGIQPDVFPAPQTLMNV